MDRLLLGGKLYTGIFEIDRESRASSGRGVEEPQSSVSYDQYRYVAFGKITQLETENSTPVFQLFTRFLIGSQLNFETHLDYMFPGLNGYLRIGRIQHSERARDITLATIYETVLGMAKSNPDRLVHKIFDGNIHSLKLDL